MCFLHLSTTGFIYVTSIMTVSFITNYAGRTLFEHLKILMKMSIVIRDENRVRPTEINKVSEFILVSNLFSYHPRGIALFNKLKLFIPQEIKTFNVII